MVQLKPLLLPQMAEPRFVTAKRRLEDFRTPPSSPTGSQSPIAVQINSDQTGYMSPPQTPTENRLSMAESLIHPAFRGLDGASDYSPPSRNLFVARGPGLCDLAEDTSQIDFGVGPMHKAMVERSDVNTCFPGGHVTILAPLQGQLELPRVYSSLGTYSDADVSNLRPAKKRRGGESPFTNIATRLTDRFPSFTRKWKLRREGKGLSDIQTHSWDPMRGFGNNSLPPTPDSSADENEARKGLTLDPISGTDGSLGINPAVLEPRTFSRSPLLPPMMYQPAVNEDLAVAQSPLAPPSIYEDILEDGADVDPVPDCVEDFPRTPKATSSAMMGAYGATPPLSMKPSLASLRRNTVTSEIRTPSASNSLEIPPLLLSEADDEWSSRLGHHNFTIHPEPHKPSICNRETCEQLELNWEVARCNFAKHLYRMGEHFGEKSNHYRLTQEKWKAIHCEWMECMKEAIAESTDGGADCFLKEMEDKTCVTAMRPVIDYRGDSKFPRLGDEDIVGPMEKVAGTGMLASGGEGLKGTQRRSSVRAAVKRLFTVKEV